MTNISVGATPTHMLTATQVRARLRAEVNKAGGQRPFADKVGVSDELVRLVLRGRREPAGRLLGALGLERVTVYRRRARLDA